MSDPQTGVAPSPIPGGRTTHEETTATTPVGLCHHCDQPVMPGDEEIVPVITGGASGVTDVLLHKGGCKPSGEAPRRHN